MVRLADSYFAVESFDKAEESLKTALNMSITEDATRAKILNNLGVVLYQRENLSEALKQFALALEIQRQWLDGPLRRDTIVYDAAVTLGNMGKVYLRKGDLDLAYFVYEEACLVRSEVSIRKHGPCRSLDLLTLLFVCLVASNVVIPKRSLVRFGKSNEHGVDPCQK